MSTDLYRNGVWFHVNRGGRAKLDGEEVDLTNPPSMLDGMVEEMEYAPDVGVARIRKRREGWTDMEQSDVKATKEWQQRHLGH